MPRTRFLTLAEAAELIPDGATVAVNSSSGLLCPDALLRAVGERFAQHGHPQNLTTIHPIAAGDMYGIDGIDHIARPGLLARVIAGSLPSGPSSMESPAIWRMVYENEVEAYNIPSGLIFHQLREAAAKRPGVLTQLGMDTFLDPRRQGGRMNERTREDIVQLVEFDGQEWLYLRALHPDVALVSGDDRRRVGQSYFREGRRLSGRLRCRAGRAQQRRRRRRPGRTPSCRQHPARPRTCACPAYSWTQSWSCPNPCRPLRPTTTPPSAARCASPPRPSSWPSGACKR